MNICKQDDGTYEVESSRRGKFYVVDLGKGTCTCPHFMVRLRKVHGMCKHMQTVKDKSEDRDSDCYFGIIDYVKEKGEVDSLELITAFNSEAVDDLLSRGELIEVKGRIRILS